jgi:hypothetical protein
LHLRRRIVRGADREHDRRVRHACRFRLKFKRNGERIAATAASIAGSASVARPRLVCSTVPVRLKTGRKLDRCCGFERVPSARRLSLVAAITVFRRARRAQRVEALPDRGDDGGPAEF